MTETEQRLIDIHGSSTLGTAQLAKELHYASAKVVRDLIAQGRFPIPTYKLGDSAQSAVVADVVDVAAYLDKRRALKRGLPGAPGQGAYTASGSASPDGR